VCSAVSTRRQLDQKLMFLKNPQLFGNSPTYTQPDGVKGIQV